MEKQNKKGLLKVALAFFAVLCFIYGIGYLFFPQTLVEASGGDPISSGWLRWSGALLIGLAVGAYRAYKRPENQELLVFTFALGTLFCGLAMLYSLLFEMLSETWFTALPTILTLACSALLWLALNQSKEILKKGRSE
jgi:drug/metabolite transporter (DMT)-like permease